MVFGGCLALLTSIFGFRRCRACFRWEKDSSAHPWGNWKQHKGGIPHENSKPPDNNPSFPHLPKFITHDTSVYMSIHLWEKNITSRKQQPWVYYLTSTLPHLSCSSPVWRPLRKLWSTWQPCCGKCRGRASRAWPCPQSRGWSSRLQTDLQNAILSKIITSNYI